MAKDTQKHGEGNPHQKIGHPIHGASDAHGDWTWARKE